MATTILDFVLSFALGALVATGELVSRYKDAPTKALLSNPGIIYLAVNGLGSVAALALIMAFHVNFGGLEGTALRVTQILTAGVGSIAFFRTSLFNATVRDTTIAIGPNILLVIILTGLDRGVDRKRAEVRSQKVSSIMKGFDFAAGADSLEMYCLRGLMQNATDDDVKAIAEVKGDLQSDLNDDIPGQVKSYILGLNLMNIVGDSVLEEAVLRIKPLVGTSSKDSNRSESDEAPQPEPVSHVSSPSDQSEVGGVPDSDTTENEG
jgi:hypothetical protein